MKTKEGFVLVAIILFMVFNLISLFNFYSFKLPYLNSAFTGAGVTGAISLFVNGPKIISIISPENRTYNFNNSPSIVYWIDLNVSSNFDVDDWLYNIYDYKHSKWLYSSPVSFNSPESIGAVRWSNKLVVFADSTDGETYNESVIFFVHVNNSAPFLGPINDSFLVCEGDNFREYINATDIDEENNNLSFDINPKNPFYILKNNVVNLTTIKGMIYSGVLSKSAVGGANSGSKSYLETVSVSDNRFVDTKKINITVIEINNAPDVSNIGVQTVWLKGDDSTFYKQVIVSDAEDGNQNSGYLDFNLSFLNSTELFNISKIGVMNFTPNESHLGVYNLSLCVTDRGLLNPSENISFCTQDGSAIKVCQNFSLTVTNKNRAPVIISSYPSNLTIYYPASSSIYFNVSVYDADGTIPDVYWLVDNVTEEYDSGSLFQEFSYSFACSEVGTHIVKVIATDGLINVSRDWTIIVDSSLCTLPSTSSGGGGGGGGGGITFIECYENWGCDSWSVCQNTQKSFDLGSLSLGDFNKISEECVLAGYLGNSCGFQLRNCIDLNNCNNKNFTNPRPFEITSCNYTITPSCDDKIKNCHDGSCELLIDCGGPCDACPTCTDGKKNQGETGIDCGGPCPWDCEEEKPFISANIFMTLLRIILTLLLIFIIVMAIKLIRHRPQQEE